MSEKKINELDTVDKPIIDNPDEPSMEELEEVYNSMCETLRKLEDMRTKRQAWLKERSEQYFISHPNEKPNVV